MRKTNLNLKRVKFAKDILKFFIIGQLLILVFGITAFRKSKPTNLSDCTQITITVDKIYTDLTSRTKFVWIQADGEKYILPNSGIFSEYSVNELLETVQPGEKIDISYEILHHFFIGKCKYIVDARNENNVYFNFERYHKDMVQAHIFIIITFTIIEVLFLVFTVVYLYENLIELKILPKRKPKKKASTSKKN